MKVTLINHTPMPEKMVTSAARVCYSGAKDLDTLLDSITDKQVDSFLNKNSLKNHGCYDGDTEVLTKRGFVKWTEIAEEDELGAIDPQTREFVGFERPKKMFKYDIDDFVLKVKKSHVDLVITENHRIYYSRNNTYGKRFNPIFEVAEANSQVQDGGMLYNKPLRMIKVAKNPKSSCENSDWYKLYGLFVGDGYYDGDANYIKFHFHKERKIKYLLDLCKKLGLETRNHGEETIVVYLLEKANEFKSFYNSTTKEKTFPDSFYAMSKEQFNSFIDGLKNSDGHDGEYSIDYSTTSKELADKIQTLCCINNTQCNVKFSLRDKSRKTLYRVRICKTLKNAMPYINDSRHKDSYFKKEKFVGTVYCATVSTGLLMIRRNGETLISGNSVWEHATFTFGLEGVSRALTHQLVRHRIASYDQQSQRYVSAKQFEYVVPPKIAKNPEAKELFEKTMSDLQNTYDRLVELGIPKEDSRYVLPNACASRLICTMNVRSLMHFFGLRCCTRAQWEIRDMANQMLKICQEVAPKVFVAGANCEQLGYCPEGDMCCGRAPTMAKLLESYKGSK